MEIKEYKSNGKEVTLFISDAADSPLIVLNCFEDEGRKVMDEVRKLDDREFSLLCVRGLNWNHDMSPWSAPRLFKGEEPFTGGADEYLELLLTRLIPEAEAMLKGKPSRMCIAGYSLAGLFALYAMYRTDAFASVASMSGSLWFPDFRKYTSENQMKRRPDKVYLSLGDKESKVRNPVMSTVGQNTEEIAEELRAQGLDVTWELNPGNHFRDAELRTAKGIVALL